MNNEKCKMLYVVCCMLFDANGRYNLPEVTGTGKMYKDVLKAIRNMEAAWEKECGRKFAPTSEKLAMLITV